jgi:hypothetical protein
VDSCEVKVCVKIEQEDGVVEVKIRWFILTTSPKSMNLKCQVNELNHMDLGTPPESGGET